MSNSILSRFGTVPIKMARQFRLLKNDPEQAGRNLLQFTDPQLFEARLLDVLEQSPLNVVVGRSEQSRLNVLQPVLDSSITGGPNTILVLAALIAEQGTPVCIVTNRRNHRPERQWFNAHVSKLLGRPAPKLLTFDVAADPNKPAVVGADDFWLATHWTTAQSLKAVLPRMKRQSFIYFVQDFEPGFYPWSTNYALALETYGMDFQAVVNEKLLAEYLLVQRVGRFAEPDFIEKWCCVFDPAVDRRVFHPPITRAHGSQRTLLVYARPTNPRNLLGLAVQSLRKVVAAGAFGHDWRFIAIGGRNSLPPIPLGNGHILHPSKWETYGDYADTLRAADALICPMLSPHTSYPVLEMAASGGRVITNTYGPKTAEALGAISPSIFAVPPTIEGFTAALWQVSKESPPVNKIDSLAFPESWDVALGPAALWISKLILGQKPPS